MKKLCLIAGLPRSGSTLLCQLLSENPKNYVTPTSGIIDIIRNIRSTFSHNPTWKAMDRMSIYENIRHSMKGFLEGFFYDKEIVFDKSRGWTINISLLDEILQNKDTKIIWCYRNPVDIVMSIESQYRKTMLLENADEAGGVPMNTTEQRLNAVIGDGGIVAQPVFMLDEAIKSGYSDRILIIKYGDLTTNPQAVLNQIHQFIGEDLYKYDTDNVKQRTFEFDGFYNYKFLHTVKEGEIKRKTHDVNNILNQEQINRINERFSWLNSYVFGTPMENIQQNQPQSISQQINNEENNPFK